MSRGIENTERIVNLASTILALIPLILRLFGVELTGSNEGDMGLVATGAAAPRLLRASYRSLIK